MLALIFGFIVFPLWVADYAYKRGLENAPMVIILTSFIGLGPLMALGYLAQASSRPLERDLIDQAQRQCPNCGGYRVAGRRAHTKTSVYRFACQL
jgi:hypothetical protein